MRVLLYQMEIALGDPERNMQKVEAVLRDNECDLLLLPELWATSYCNRDFPRLAPTVMALEDRIAQLSREHQCVIVGSNLHQVTEGDIRNHLQVWAHGEPELSYDKMHLFRLLGEDRSLCAGDSMGWYENSPWLGNYGAGICYDLRFPEMFRTLAVRGAHLILLPSEWPLARVDHFRAMCISRAIENQCWFLTCNNAGWLADKVQFAGNSLVVDPWGKVLAEGSQSGEELLEVDIDLELAAEVRGRIPVFQDRRPELYS